MTSTTVSPDPNLVIRQLRELSDTLVHGSDDIPLREAFASLKRAFMVLFGVVCAVVLVRYQAFVCWCKQIPKHGKVLLQRALFVGGWSSALAQPVWLALLCWS